MCVCRIGLASFGNSYLLDVEVTPPGEMVEKCDFTLVRSGVCRVLGPAPPLSFSRQASTLSDSQMSDYHLMTPVALPAAVDPPSSRTSACAPTLYACV